MKTSRIVWLLLLAGSSACTVGPDYRRPTIATPSVFAEAAPAASADANAPDAALARWWDLFKDPTLTGLIDQALANNPDLQSAASRVRESRLQEIVTRAAEYPSISAAVSAVTVHSNQSSASSASSDDGASGGSGSTSTAGSRAGFAIPSALNLYSAAFDATWELDLFGGTRRAVEAARANTQAMIWARRDGEVSLSGEVANDYLTLRDLQTRIALERGEVQRQQDLFTLIRERRQTGFVTQLNVNQQTGQIESATAQIPAMEAQARGEIHALGVLVGETPEALEDRLGPAAALPASPPALPLGLPSELLRRRPDIREAERRLAASNAQIGVQVASLYPKFDLLAFGGFAGTSLSSLFSAKDLLGAAVGMATEPLFDAGRRRASVGIAKEETAQATLAYRKAVLGALRDVEDALSRYRSENIRHASLMRSVEATRNSLTIAQDEYQTGFVTFINVLQAQSALLGMQDQLALSDGQLLSDLVALYKALGGGWSSALSPRP